MKKILPFILSAFAILTCMQAQVVYDNNGTGSDTPTGSGSTFTIPNFTVPVNNDVILIIVTRSNQSKHITNILFDGTNYGTTNKFGECVIGSFIGEIYAISLGNVAAPVTSDIVVTLDGNVAARGGIAASYHDVNQTTPLTDFTGCTGATITVPNAVNGDMVFDAFAASDQNPIPNETQVGPIVTIHATLDIEIGMSQKLSSGGSEAMTWNSSGDMHFGAVLKTTNPLPVEMIGFEVWYKEGHTHLQWRTASELNNAGFHLQRSIDGKNWQDLAFLPGHGTTHEEQSYTYNDERPLPGLNYYRLRQVDYDGQFEYSKVISVEIERNGSGISLFPNPASSSVSVTLALETDYTGKASLTLYDLMGKQVKTQVLALEGGAFRSEIGLGGLPTGVYLAEVQAGNERWRERLVVE